MGRDTGKCTEDG